jgi:single-strand DNA-binding protein
MKDVNVVVLVGRLTRDAELKYTTSGMAICHFSVAVNRNRKQGDQWIEEAGFFDVDFFGKGGEAVNQYLVKGKQVAIEGELRQDKWEQDGQSRSKVIINASNVQLLGSAGGQGGQGSTAGQPGSSYEKPQARPKDPAPKPGSIPAGPSGGDDFTDDIPF